MRAATRIAKLYRVIRVGGRFGSSVRVDAFPPLPGLCGLNVAHIKNGKQNELAVERNGLTQTARASRRRLAS